MNGGKDKNFNMLHVTLDQTSTFSASAAMKGAKRTVRRIIGKQKLALLHGSWARSGDHKFRKQIFSFPFQGEEATEPVQTLLKMKIWKVSIQRSTHNLLSPRSPLIFGSLIWTIDLVYFFVLHPVHGMFFLYVARIL